MKRTVHKSEYFYGNKISNYGLENGYLDYATLAKAFDSVMVNDITKLFYADINGKYCEPEQINGYIDNSEEIEDLNDRISELMENITEDSTEEEDAPIYAAMEELQNQIDELEREQYYQPEIYQYFIISENGVNILQEYTNDPVYYIDTLDMYIWGVTHWGTLWDYVLTDVKLDWMKEDYKNEYGYSMEE